MLFGLQIALTDAVIGVVLAVSIFGGAIVGFTGAYFMVRKGIVNWTKDE